MAQDTVRVRNEEEHLVSGTHRACLCMVCLTFLQKNIKTVILIPNTGTTGPHVKLRPPHDTRITNGYSTRNLTKVKLPPAVYVPLGKGREKDAADQGFQEP